MLIVLNSSYYDTNMEINSEHISILITGNVVISFTESNNPVFENAYKAIESNMLNIRRKNSGLLLAFLLNTIIANLVESASKVEEMLEDMKKPCSISKTTRAIWAAYPATSERIYGYPQEQPTAERTICQTAAHREWDHKSRHPSHL